MTKTYDINDSYLLPEDVTKLRIYIETDGDGYRWALDGVNQEGTRYTAALFSAKSLNDVCDAIPEFIRDFAPNVWNKKATIDSLQRLARC